MRQDNKGVRSDSVLRRDIPIIIEKENMKGGLDGVKAKYTKSHCRELTEDEGKYVV